MKIFFDSVNFDSCSGPNSFARKLARAMSKRGHAVTLDPLSRPDVQLSFIQVTQRAAPKIALRLDGIYFNTSQDWNALNEPIKKSFEVADIIVYQTQFNKRLTEKYFGTAKRDVVISNGTSLDEISAIQPMNHPSLAKYDEVWCCSSSWRPHKRLSANIEYFTKLKQKNVALIVMGGNSGQFIDYSSTDILITGEVDWQTCISVYKASKKFLHLAFLDHCPNVVVDARACGCEIVVASSGGTKEIAGIGATVVQDLDWDLRPLDLYRPPNLDFKKTYTNMFESNIDIDSVAEKYESALTTL